MMKIALLAAALILTGCIVEPYWGHEHGYGRGYGHGYGGGYGGGYGYGNGGGDYHR